MSRILAANLIDITDYGAVLWGCVLVNSFFIKKNENEMQSLSPYTNQWKQTMWNPVNTEEICVQVLGGSGKLATHKTSFGSARSWGSQKLRTNGNMLIWLRSS